MLIILCDTRFWPKFYIYLYPLADNAIYGPNGNSLRLYKDLKRIKTSKKAARGPEKRVKPQMCLSSTESRY